MPLGRLCKDEVKEVHGSDQPEASLNPQGVLYSTREAQTSKTRVLPTLRTPNKRGLARGGGAHPLAAPYRHQRYPNPTAATPTLPCPQGENKKEGAFRLCPASASTCRQAGAAIDSHAEHLEVTKSEVRAPRSDQI
eukprot:797183-Prorocentrum_minimum.AAC.1